MAIVAGIALLAAMARHPLGRLAIAIGSWCGLNGIVILAVDRIDRRFRYHPAQRLRRIRVWLITVGIVMAYLLLVVSAIILTERLGFRW